MSRACPDCLARSWLLGRLAGHLEPVRARIGPLLALGDDQLTAAVGGRQRTRIERERADLDPRVIIEAARAAGIEPLCRCDPWFPARLQALDAPPAVLYVAGGLDRFLTLAQAEPVAIVGSRRASEYGTEMARSLGRGLAASGLTVVSGMARGIDAAAHRGALEAGKTITVLPGPAERPYPPGQRALYRAITAQAGVAISELPPGTGVRKWCFLARNRLIAGLSAMTVVVEATPRSGSLPAAATARQLHRPVGAVPGRVTSAQATGPNGLLASGATVIRDAQDVLDRLYGIGARSVPSAERRAPPSSEQARLLQALGNGQAPAAAVLQARIPPERGLSILSELELAGWIRRGPGGSFAVIP